MNAETEGEYPPKPKRILDHEKYLRTVDLWERIAEIFGRILLVCSSAFPLWLVYKSVDAIAGKETAFDVNVAVAFALTAGGAGFTALVMWLKNRSQTRELQRLRARIKMLEERSGLRTEESR